MICRNCNAEIDDNAVQCPFCSTPTTVDVDPNAAPETPAQDYSQPAPEQPAYDQQTPPPAPSYQQTTPPPVQPTVVNDPNDPATQANKKAKTIFILGIIGVVCFGLALILGIINIVSLGLCCCYYIFPPAALVLGIVGFVMAKKMEGNTYLLTEEGQKHLKVGRILCLVTLIGSIVTAVLAIVSMILLAAAGSSGALMEALEDLS